MIHGYFGERFSRRRRTGHVRFLLRRRERRGQHPHPLGERRELLGDAHRGRAADAVATGDRALDGEHLAHVGREQRVTTAASPASVDLVELEAALLAEPDERAGDLVRVAERDAAA